MLSNNGSCYRSRAWTTTCAELGIRPKKTRPYRPPTNDKIERFHRTLADGWAFARLFPTEATRRNALPAWLHEYNHHRPHTAIGSHPPASARRRPGPFGIVRDARTDGCAVRDSVGPRSSPDPGDDMVTPVRTSSRWQRLALLVSSLAVVISAIVLAAPAAEAQPATAVGTAASAADLGGPVTNGWNGDCPVALYATKAWGYCDGTGPQRYQLYAYCTDGRYYGSGVTPWFGDRRGAWVYCPSGSYVSYVGWWYA
jgi:hypothetical protein